MQKDELSPEEAYDLIASQLRDRMSEYLAAIDAFPNVDPLAKVDIWNAVVNKRNEIDQLQAQLSETATELRAQAPQTATAAASLLYRACRAVSWDVPQQNDERVLAHWCQQQALAIRDPVARQSALDWIRRALRYAQAGRSGPTVTCVTNAKQLLSR
ncbi:hypothetical protein [Sorangium atrum]|uniref:Uncharacterized protein n=1 Tax=Sorangium atrum TaxID=2995308 RepID=A0ABT5C1B4_9BACT|nr:hypothetical protein [Sorangium aterium]MDC0678982.1 hypothetical protein [Sorangium aterium]